MSLNELVSLTDHSPSNHFLHHETFVIRTLIFSSIFNVEPTVETEASHNISCLVEAPAIRVFLLHQNSNSLFYWSVLYRWVSDGSLPHESFMVYVCQSWSLAAFFSHNHRSVQTEWQKGPHLCVKSQFHHVGRCLPFLNFIEMESVCLSPCSCLQILLQKLY